MVVLCCLGATLVLIRPPSVLRDLHVSLSAQSHPVLESDKGNGGQQRTEQIGTR